MKLKDLFKFGKKKEGCGYSYGTFVRLFPIMTDESKERCTKLLLEQKRPSVFMGREVPEDLNLITYGQLDDITSIDEKADPLSVIAKVLFGIDPEEAQQEDCLVAFGLINFVTEQIKGISKLFKSVKIDYSQEEINAGVKSLDFGTFGVLDWYSRRMHIADQNDVLAISWVRIYATMKNDATIENYQRRYHKQLSRMLTPSRPSFSRRY